MEEQPTNPFITPAGDSIAEKLDPWSALRLLFWCFPTQQWSARIYALALRRAEMGARAHSSRRWKERHEDAEFFSSSFVWPNGAGDVHH
jgi:hypothetical protein